MVKDEELIFFVIYIYAQIIAPIIPLNDKVKSMNCLMKLKLTSIAWMSNRSCSLPPFPLPLPFELYYC